MKFKDGGKGTMRKALVYDDYAHHPTEIKATLRAAKEHFPKQPIICVFQPHQGKRLELLFKEFTAAFDDADVVVLLPLYKVRGREERCAQSSESLARAITSNNPHKFVFYVKDPRKLRMALSGLFTESPFAGISRSPIVVMMGAGDIVNHTGKLLQ